MKKSLMILLTFVLLSMFPMCAFAAEVQDPVQKQADLELIQQKNPDVIDIVLVKSTTIIDENNLPTQTRVYDSITLTHPTMSKNVIVDKTFFVTQNIPEVWAYDEVDDLGNHWTGSLDKVAEIRERELVYVTYYGTVFARS